MALVVKSFSKSIPSAGTPVPLSETRIYTTAFVIRANLTNAGLIYVGDENVDSSSGMFLQTGEVNEKEGKPNARGTLQTFNLQNVYVDAATSGDSFRVEYLDEES
jgi:hypothetical protein